GGVVVERVRHLDGATEGFNDATGEYEDLVKAGIIDAAKVTRSALQNASSIAALFLTTEAVIADKPEEAAGGMPGGMDDFLSTSMEGGRTRWPPALFAFRRRRCALSASSRGSKPEEIGGGGSLGPCP